MDNMKELETLYGLLKELKQRLAEYDGQPETCDVCRARREVERSIEGVERQIECVRNDSEPSFSEFQVNARRTQRAEWTDGDKLTHSLRGLAAEVGELNSIFQKQMQGHAVCQEDVEEEIGDVMWFLAELADSHGIELGTVARRNMMKRMVRYPNGFSEEDSINRRDHV